MTSTDERHRPATAATGLRRMARHALVTALLGGALVLAWDRWSGGWRADPAAWPVQGLLIGPENAPVSWPGVAQGPAQFAYISATRGARAINPGFTRDHDAAARHNIRTGAVHHYSLCAPVGDQSAAFVRLVPRESSALPPLVFVDQEDGCTNQPTRALLLAELSTFLGQIETHMGKQAVIAPDEEMESRYAIASAINRPLLLRSVRAEPADDAPTWALWLANDRLRMTGASGSVIWLVLNDRGSGQ